MESIASEKWDRHSKIWQAENLNMQRQLLQGKKAMANKRYNTFDIVVVLTYNLTKEADMKRNPTKLREENWNKKHSLQRQMITIRRNTQRAGNTKKKNLKQKWTLAPKLKETTIQK